MSNGSDIIIKGGSVELHYDESLYQKEGAGPRKHPGKKIIRITVVDEYGKTQYDSEEKDDGYKWEIRAHCR